MVRATWNGAVRSNSDDTVVVKNHSFPRRSLRQQHLQPSDHTSTCPWKGQARYLDVAVGGGVNPAAAWYDAEPKDAASEIRDRVASWHRVRVEQNESAS